MSDKLKEFARETIAELLRTLPPEERLKGLSPEQVRKAVPPEQYLDELSIDDMIAGLSPEKREALLRRLTNGKSGETTSN
jgi:hypothetical protein